MHYSLLNHRISEYNEYLRALWRVDTLITYQGYLGLNGSNWYNEFRDGVHLTEEAMMCYCRSVCSIIHSAYH